MKRAAVVKRVYRADAESCARAVELLLKTSARKGGGSETAPDDAKGRSNDDFRTAQILPR